MTNKIIIFLFICTILCSCSRKTNTELVFPKEIELTKSNLIISKDSLARIEGLQSNDSLLIVWDFHLGKSYTLFNVRTGTCYGRFGSIGQGPAEIPLGCGGYISQNKYKVFNCAVGYIAQYDIDSLCMNINEEPEVLSRKIFTDDIFFSAVIPVNDSLYFGAGVYESKNQYVLFDNKDRIVDANVLIYNANNNFFDKSQKVLSNQGRLAKAPDSNKYAFVLNYSSNIDFIEVVDNKINVLKLLRERDPLYTPIQEGTMRAVYPDKNSSIGYIYVTSGKNFVYALYTDKKLDQAFSSNIVYVFDWNSNPVKKYKLANEAYYITVNEVCNQLYAAVREEDGGWNIISYDMI